MIPSLGIAGVFEQACRWKGEQPFLLDSYVRWTGREAWRQARTVASALRAKGVA